MRRLLWVLAIVFLALGCRPGKPKDILEPEEMEKILYDIHIVDGYLSTVYIPDSARKLGSEYYNGIYKKFDTDSAQYTRSLAYYYQNPEDLEKIYKNISSKISKEKIKIDKADSVAQAKIRKADSLKLAKDPKKLKADSLKKVDSLKKAEAKKVETAKTVESREKAITSKISARARLKARRSADSLRKVKSKKARLLKEQTLRK
ncbi:hypothetical protein DHW03_05375 [Pedobacter yonginense]|uniref:DUF4296 domain-containing protein n=1 Tax=Pedobacter yonginense TaxID=651869 RepID=A0A317ES55_9SPHI|nr:DUF4296 domain-containing protein [Pedobacter yonginense]PWS29252.1 hypothetical protein DHW03_05375 [Pedobacter yonginense]